MSEQRAGDRPPSDASGDQLYQAAILDHDRNPRNAGPLPDATHHATLDNPLCGDVVTLHARIADGVLRDLRFEGQGCALSRAAASMMSTMVRDRTADSLRQLAASFTRFIQDPPDAAIPDELGELRALAGVRRSRSRRVCATLAFRALLRVLEPH